VDGVSVVPFYRARVYLHLHSRSRESGLDVRHRGSQHVSFGDHFYVKYGEGSTYKIDTSRTIQGTERLEYVTVETGFKTKAEAMARAAALYLAPELRRARFKLVAGGKS
jgi:hypothetical protein